MTNYHEQSAVRNENIRNMCTAVCDTLTNLLPSQLNTSPAHQVTLTQWSAVLLHFPYPFSGYRTSQDHADIADVKCTCSQRENTPYHGNDTQSMVTEQITGYNETNPRDEPEYAAGHTVQEY